MGPESTPGTELGDARADSNPEHANGPRYNFVFCDHTAENVPAIVEQIKDCDIVAIEGVGKTTEERQGIESLANRLSRVAPDSPEAAQLLDRLRAHVSGAMEDLLSSLAGKGKTITLIDVDQDHPIYSLITDAGNLLDYYAEAQISKPTPHLRNIVRDLVADNAIIDQFREAAVITQLQSMPQQGVEKETDVAVIEGKAHTPVYHAMGRAGYMVHRDFVAGDEDVAPPEKAHFSYMDRATRAERINPAWQPDKLTLNRIVLETMIRGFTGDEFGATHMVEGLDDQTVEGILAEVDETKMRVSIEGIDHQLQAIKTLLKSKDLIDGAL